MKTSKYIQVALLIFIFATTLVLFLDAKSITITPKPLHKVKGYYDSKLLDDFSVIVAEKNSKFWIRNDSISSVYYQHRDKDGRSKSDFGFECFSLKNDTLFVSSVDENYWLYVNTQSVNKIIGKENSEIGLSGYYSDTLNITITKAKIKGSLRNDSINVLKIDANNHSDISFGRITRKVIDSITKEEKFIPLNDKLKEAEITLKDHSKIKITKPQKLIIESDDTSHYTIFNGNSNGKELITTSTLEIVN
ncbi:hypothetical protein [Seonamhaeicola aphaedonensis]|uniref:Uncharacterized protein n=1 Tax=Seonamhaeicola aphaedonensis TaxID=1461338 RepID=A0A3D9HEJ3_9FLAO|nr:hypothetical protein [Seonamhaeicola aphaedonensis]RED47893.1 hypothetical protein DFQ02_105120 [Seonamhaeicola aphaedonensis]